MGGSKETLKHINNNNIVFRKAAESSLVMISVRIIYGVAVLTLTDEEESSVAKSL